MQVTIDRAVVTGAHRELLDQVLDKWSLRVLDELCEAGALRFNGLRRAIPAISQKSLVATLRRLERNGMIERVVLSDRPIAVEYRIAPVGHELQPLIDALLDWTTVQLPAVEDSRARFDAAHGRRAAGRTPEAAGAQRVEVAAGRGPEPGAAGRRDC